MQVSRRALLRTGRDAGLAAAIFGGSIAAALANDDGKPAASDAHAVAAVSAEEALAILRAGNRAFVAGKPPHYPFGEARRREIAKGQTPFAVIVSCSDSRVGPEQIFECGLGQIFVIRNAGNTVANSQAMGSIEYAVEHLHVPLVVVLGHSHCGAVTAAVDVEEKHVALPGSLAGMVEPIRPAVEIAKLHDAADLVEESVRENVRLIAHDLRSPRQPILAPVVRAGKLWIVGAEYSLDTGGVDFFDLS